MDGAEPQLRELQEELSELRSLQRTRGYARLMFIAEEQVKARTSNVILNALKCMDDVLEQEYKKGEIAGIQLIMEMTNTHILALESEIESKLNEVKENDSSETLDETAGT